MYLPEIEISENERRQRGRWDASIVGRCDRDCSISYGCQVRVGSLGVRGTVITGDTLEIVLLQFNCAPTLLTEDELKAYEAAAALAHPDFRWDFSRSIPSNPDKVELTRRPVSIPRYGYTGAGEVVGYVEMLAKITSGRISVEPEAS
jgi:hypothetical protein